MKLYHYSPIELTELKSRIAQGIKSAGDHGIKGYASSISFFLEPIPLDIAEILKHEHDFWISGRELYQHEIDSNDLPLNVDFILVETPDKTKLLYDEQDWTKAEGNPELVKQYKQEIEDLENKKGYRGKGRMKLVQVCKPFTKGISKYYQDMYKLHCKYPEDNLIKKYAATVPHLMVYVGRDSIPVTMAKKITLA